MATADARDVAADEQQQQSDAVGKRESAMVDEQGGPNGRQEAELSTGRRRRRTRRRRKRKKGGAEADAAIEEELREEEEEEEEEKGTPSAETASEQIAEQKLSSGDEDQHEPFPSLEPKSPERSPSAPDAMSQTAEQKLIDTEANPPAKKGGRPTKAAVDAMEDELLLRAVVAHEKQFTDETLPRMSVWESVAAACGDRFSKATSATGKVVWLTAVYRDHRHDQHGSFTDAMKALMKQYLDFMGIDDSPRTMQRKRKGLPFKNPSSARRAKLRELQRQQRQSQQGVDEPEFEPPEEANAQEDAVKDGGEDVAEDDKERESEKEEERATAPRVLTALGRRVLDVAEEEKLVKIAINYIPHFMATKLKSAVWEKIASETAGLYKTSHSILNHFLWLLRIAHEPSHDEHKKITPKLRKMLEKLEKVCFSKRRTKLSMPEERKAVDPPRETGTAPVVPVSPVEAKPREVTSLEINPELDTKLLENQLKFRPFDFHPQKERPGVWKSSLEALRDPRLTNSTAASRRVYWLRLVVAKTDHEQHSNLTSKLRKLVAQYNEAVKRSPYQGKSRSTSSADSGTVTSISSTTTRDASARLQKVIIAELEAARVEKRRKMDETESALSSVGSVASENTAIPTTFEDHVLLVEILRAPPFLAKKKGGCNPQWERVATAVMKQIGSSAVLRTAEACMRRMVKLLTAVRSPGGKSSVSVPDEQLEMLRLIHTLTGFKSTWASIERHQTELYVSLKERMKEVLKHPLPTPHVSALPITSTTRVEASEEKPEEGEGEVYADAETTPVREQALPVLDAQERQRKRKRGEENVLAYPIPIISPSHSVRASLTGHLEPREPVPLADNRSIAAEIKALQENVALYRAELTVCGSRQETGRRGHRQELLTMFELLKHEHDSQTNATAVILDTLEAERLETREEFANMIALVSQALPSC